uniref:Uncharacterized protein n=1 Tax=Rhizophora mucronata TaxID=61149 RepID=A0A2P2QMT4_RHIMU
MVTCCLFSNLVQSFALYAQWFFSSCLIFILVEEM